MSLVVAVTGGIGSGKSTVAGLFQRLGAGLVDTDAIAHELTQPDRPALRQIAQCFGAQYFAADGSLDRAKLRARVFSDPDARRSLEAILHPAIRGEVDSRLSHISGPYALVVVPLLVETGGYRDRFQRVLVVDCDERLQIERIVQRDGIDEDQARAILRAQASRTERLELADDVIRNDGTLDDLVSQVRALDARYRALAHAK